MKDVKYSQDVNFDDVDFTSKDLNGAEYDSCVFSNCSFVNVDLTRVKFMDCTFIECDMSMATLEETSFQKALFRHSKMLGLRFDTCNTFGFSAHFEDCILDHAVFHETDLTRSSFKNCKIREADFGMVNAAGSKIAACDLHHTIFERSNLEGADLTNSINFQIDPSNNQIKGAKFNLPGVLGLLTTFQIELEE